MRFQNETALITGGTSGIGRKLAKRLLKEGCKVAIFSRNEERVRNTVNKFQEVFGDHILGMVGDVSKPESLQSIVSQTVAKFGSIRILVANAGINLKYGPFSHYSPEEVYHDAHKIIGINLIGAMNSIAAVLPQMRKQKYGRIITLSGGGADRPIGNMTFYSASKGGVLTFSKCLAVEFDEEIEAGNQDIRLNIYQPGMLKTHLTQSVEVVDNWESKEKATNDTNMALEYMGADIDKSTSKVLPYLLPSCSKNGTLFRGFSLFKLILGAIKLQKKLKSSEKQ